MVHHCLHAATAPSSSGNTSPNLEERRGKLSRILRTSANTIYANHSDQEQQQHGNRMKAVCQQHDISSMAAAARATMHFRRSYNKHVIILVSLSLFLHILLRTFDGPEKGAASDCSNWDGDAVPVVCLQPHVCNLVADVKHAERKLIFVGFRLPYEELPNNFRLPGYE